MRIKNFRKYSESISGTVDTMPFGPNFPRQELKNTISQKDTVLIQGSDGIIYDLFKFEDLYNTYLKVGGKEPLSDFNQENLDKLIHYLK